MSYSHIGGKSMLSAIQVQMDLKILKFLHMIVQTMSIPLMKRGLASP